MTLNLNGLLLAICFATSASAIDVTQPPYNVVPNDGQDDTAGIQAALLAVGSDGRVDLPSGTLDIYDTLQVGDGVSYTTTILSGRSGTYDAVKGSTRLLCHFADRPAINVAGGRNVKIENLALEGCVGVRVAEKNALKNTPMPTTDEQVFLGIGTTNQYGFSVGITTDSFFGAKPAGGYPHEYGHTHLSSNTTIKNCFIQFFNTGVATRGSPSNANGEYLKLVNVYCKFCWCGLSVNHSQARLTSATDSYFHNNYIGVGGGLNGPLAQQSIYVTRCEFSLTTFAIRSVATNWASVISLTECYGEALGSIGYIGHGANYNGPIAVVEGCTFRFSPLPLATHLSLYRVMARVQDCWFRVSLTDPRDVLSIRSGIGTLSMDNTHTQYLSRPALPDIPLLITTDFGPMPSDMQQRENRAKANGGSELSPIVTSDRTSGQVRLFTAVPTWDALTETLCGSKYPNVDSIINGTTDPLVVGDLFLVSASGIERQYLLRVEETNPKASTPFRVKLLNHATDPDAVVEITGLSWGAGGLVPKAIAYRTEIETP